MAAEVMREDMRGDAGDADFEEEVSGRAGPGGSVFQQRREGVEKRRGWSFVEGVDDGVGVIWER